jgi:hypothetical protein
MDISVWMDLAVGDGSRVDRLLKKRMEVALWVLSYNGTVGEYLKRWRRDVCDTPRLVFNLAGYGLFVKKIFRIGNR